MAWLTTKIWNFNIGSLTNEEIMPAWQECLIEHVSAEQIAARNELEMTLVSEQGWTWKVDRANNQIHKIHQFGTEADATAWTQPYAGMQITECGPEWTLASLSVTQGDVSDTFFQVVDL